MKSSFLRLTAAILLLAILLAAQGCALMPDQSPSASGSPDNAPPSESNAGLTLSGSVDLMLGFEGSPTASRAPDDRFIYSQADFGLKLFKQCVDNDKNSLVSPLSVMIALAMTANGADGATLEEMEALLGGDISIDELNEYLRTYIASLPSSESSKLDIANSIWFRDTEDLKVKDEFLQKNSDYYGASIYKSPFDASTVKDINGWVYQKTDKMIDNIINEIDYSSVMFLINAICFDAEWETPYDSEYGVIDGSFYGASGVTDAELMLSSESLFISDESSKGFIKKYKNGYSFMAILPNKDVSLSSYIDALSGDDLVRLYRSATYAEVAAALPKFKYDYSVDLMDPLKALGMKNAFVGGFQNMAESSYGDLYIGSAKHKTFIEVNNMGTRAAAVTMIEMKVESCPQIFETVTLDRPFLYAIVDDATGLPIFIGTLLDVQ